MNQVMIDLYAWAIPNSIKVPILLEELGLAYTVKPINVRQGEQKTPLIRPMSHAGMPP
jgi:GST-like protein